MELNFKNKDNTPIPVANLQIIIDISKKDISFDINDLYFCPVHLFFGFRTNGNLPVKFDNMTFGYTISSLCSSPDLVSFVQTKSYPGYIETNSEYSQHETITLCEEKEYELTVWCYNNKERFSKKTQFSIQNWQEYYPKEISVPRPRDVDFGRIVVRDPWWI